MNFVNLTYTWEVRNFLEEVMLKLNLKIEEDIFGQLYKWSSDRQGVSVVGKGDTLCRGTEMREYG